MKTKLGLKMASLFALVLMFNMVFAQQVIRLYDGPAPGSENWTQKEYRYEYMSPIWHEQNVALFNVVDPTLTVFLPAPGKATGVALLVIPGGGFSALSWNNEGPDVAKKLAEMGITAFVLKYRIAYSGSTHEEANLIARTSYGGEDKTIESKELDKKNQEFTKSMAANYKSPYNTGEKWNNPFMERMGNVTRMSVDDGKLAIEYIRKNAGKYNIKPDKIGMVGFSAGGMLALNIAFDHTEQQKPNLIGVIYGFFGAGNEIPSDPMPMFMAANQNEILGGQGLYEAWCKAKLPAEIHSFTGAVHGFGYRNNGDSVNIWIDLFYNFMKKTGFIE
jgi:dienelactone hydrolase